MRSGKSFEKENFIDCYAYTTADGVNKEKEYFIPIGEEEYMGIALSKSYLAKADNNMYATWDYMEGDAEALENLETIVRFCP